MAAGVDIVARGMAASGGGGGGGSSKVDDVLLNGTSTVSNKIANIKIKTINGTSITGEGDVVVGTTEPDDTTIEINSNKKLQVKNSGIGSSQIADNAILTAKIKDDSITTVKIKDANITTAKIKDDAITKDKIDDNAKVVYEEDTQTITNKTIDADDNTIQNIQNTNFKTLATTEAGKLLKVDTDGSVKWMTGDETSVDDVTIEKNSSKQLQVKDDGIVTEKIKDDAVTIDKIADKNISKEISETSTDEELSTAKAVYDFTKKFGKSIEIVDADKKLNLKDKDGNILSSVTSSQISGITKEDTVELKNKTIDADNNTIKNLETDNLKEGVLQTTVRDKDTATDTTIASEKAIRTALNSAAYSFEIETVSASEHKYKFILKDKDGNVLSEPVFDLPLELIKLVDFKYDNVGEKFILTWQDAQGEEHTIEIPASGILKGVVTETATQTLTNKTIDADNNIISNLEGDNFKTVDTTNAGKAYVVQSDGTFALDTAYQVDDVTINKTTEGKLQIKDSGVSTSKIEDGAVTFKKINDTAVALEVRDKDTASNEELTTEKAVRTELDKLVVTVEKQETAETNCAATYVIKQNDTQVGVKVNIPLDYVLKSVEVKTCTTDDDPVAGYKVGEKYLDFVINVKEGTATDTHIYTILKDFMYSANTGVTIEDNVIKAVVDGISIEVADNKIGIKDAGVTTTKITDKAVTKAKIDPDAKVVYEADEQTLTNKTIDVDNNTLSNIEVDNFKDGVVKTVIEDTAADTELATNKAIYDFTKTFAKSIEIVDADKKLNLKDKDGNVLGSVTSDQISGITKEDTVELKNKTIDADNNTISNIEADNLKTQTASDKGKAFRVIDDGTWELQEISDFKDVDADSEIDTTNETVIWRVKKSNYIQRYSVSESASSRYTIKSEGLNYTTDLGLTEIYYWTNITDTMVSQWLDQGVLVEDDAGLMVKYEVGETTAYGYQPEVTENASYTLKYVKNGVIYLVDKEISVDDESIELQNNTLKIKGYNSSDKSYTFGDLTIDSSGNTVQTGTVKASGTIAESSSDETLARTDWVAKMLANNITAEYSSGGVYAVDDYCVHENKLYKCNTAITTPETWDSSKWDETTVIDNLKSGGYTLFKDVSEFPSAGFDENVIYRKYVTTYVQGYILSDTDYTLLTDNQGVKYNTDETITTWDVVYSNWDSEWSSRFTEADKDTATVVKYTVGETTGLTDVDYYNKNIASSSSEVKYAKDDELFIFGTTNYNDLENKPQVNGVELEGNKTSTELKIVWEGTQAEYDALTETDANTIYIITDESLVAGVSYNDLTDKPTIEGIVVSGEKTLTDFGAATIDSVNAKQNIADDTLNTSAKTVPLAINEVYAMCKSLSGKMEVLVVSALPTTPPTSPTIYYVGTAAPYEIYLYSTTSGEYTSLGTSSTDLTGYLKETDVVDNLTSTAANKPLSANQGKVLDEEKEDVSNKITSVDSSSDDTHYPTAKAVYSYSEALANKTTSLSSSSTDNQYPSAKAVYDYTDDTYLPLKGGTMTGSIKSSADIAIKSINDSSQIRLQGGSGADKGARIVLQGKDNSGGIYLEGYNGTSRRVMYLGPDGSLTWGENDISGNITKGTVTLNTGWSGSIAWVKVGHMVTLSINGLKKTSSSASSTVFTLPYGPYNNAAVGCPLFNPASGSFAINGYLWCDSNAYPYGFATLNEGLYGSCCYITAN